MKVSYEANLICDFCGDACVTGDPMDSPEDARQSAIKEARKESWDALDDDQFKCLECKEREVAIAHV